eukprot:gene6051-8198_t
MRAVKLLLPVLALLAACSDPAAKSQAQDAGLAQPTKAPPSSVEGMKTSFAPVVKRAAPAVVNVSSRYPVIYARPDSQDATVAEVVGAVNVEPFGSRYAPVVVEIIGRSDRRDPMGIHASAGEGVGLGRYSEMTLG